MYYYERKRREEGIAKDSRNMLNGRFICMYYECMCIYIYVCMVYVYVFHVGFICITNVNTVRKEMRKTVETCQMVGMYYECMCIYARMAYVYVFGYVLSGLVSIGYVLVKFG
jgi:hypothetical protein